MRSLTEIIEVAEHWARHGGHEQSAAAGELYSLIRDLAEHLKSAIQMGGEEVRSEKSEVRSRTSDFLRPTS